MSIHPLPQFEADVAELARDRLIETLRCRGHDPQQLGSLETSELEVLARKKAKTTLVVRYGSMRMIGEFPYSGDMTPGCGSRLVVRTHRGTEMGELLTSTCPNSGCGSSVSRKEMLAYIDNSGGRQYPFTTEGRVLRVATKEDMDEQARLEQSRHGLKMDARAVVESMGVPMRIVDAEPILGGERLTLYYMSEDRVDFRDLVRELGGRFRSRIDMRQVGARDEARLAADYEKCGQYCCCKNFLKVLKPISMKSAKVQKATLDPVKISGRCGRLMCCLRYEDETYESLAKNLPKRKSKVGTPDGDGLVINTQILTQLVLVRLDSDGETQAYPVEEIGKPGERPASTGPARERREPRPGRRENRGESKGERSEAKSGRRERGSRRGASKKSAGGEASRPVEQSGAPSPAKTPETVPGPDGTTQTGSSVRKKRRRRRKRRGDGGEAGVSAPEQTGSGRPDTPLDGGNSSTDSAHQSPPTAQGGSAAEPGEADGNQASPGPKKKRRRRRRRRKPDGEGGAPGSDGGVAPGNGGDSGGSNGGDGEG